MAKWIDDFGDYLAREHPDKFQLSQEGHWVFKTKNNWVHVPHHYVPGIILTLGGLTGLKKSEGTLAKILSLVVTGVGTYLVLDDIVDLKKDIKDFFG